MVSAACISKADIVALRSFVPNRRGDAVRGWEPRDPLRDPTELNSSPPPKGRGDAVRGELRVPRGVVGVVGENCPLSALECTLGEKRLPITKPKDDTNN